MAELNTDDHKKEKGSGKVRSKKSNSKVDLTAMVDLAFLLITFFMLTTTLSKPQSMSLAMPDKSDPTENNETKVSENRTVTLLLGTDNKILWYMGQANAPIEGPNTVGYGKNEIRKVLLDKVKQVVTATRDEEKGLIVIIKPCDKSDYRNLVDVLDEMVITQVQTYAIVDISDIDMKLLEENGLY